MISRPDIFSERTFVAESSLTATRPLRFRLQKKGSPYFMIAPAILIILGITIFPLIFSIGMSMTPLNLARPGSESEFIGLRNYRDILLEPRFWRTLSNTMIMVTLAVTFEFFVGLLLAALLNREFGGRRLVTILFLIPTLIVPVVIGMIWRLLLNEGFGLINYVIRTLKFGRAVPWVAKPTLALFVMIFIDIWEWTPLMFLILLAGMMSLSREPFEAAEIEGATSWQMFWRITVPLLQPVILVALLIRLIDAFKLFDTIFVITAGGPGLATETTSMYIYYKAFKHFDIGIASSISWLFLLIIIVITTFLLKFISRTER
jgi:multiple sugar transport system permease protein